jgi:hypothetical protein
MPGMAQRLRAVRHSFCKIRASTVPPFGIGRFLQAVFRCLIRLTSLIRETISKGLVI